VFVSFSKTQPTQTNTTVKSVIKKIIGRSTQAVARGKTCKSLKKVQRELIALGIFHGLLDEIELCVSRIPSWAATASGWFYDCGVGKLAKFMGYREDVIYLAQDTVYRADKLQIIRHEFAHAWAWRNPQFLQKKWFRATFKRSYFGKPWASRIPWYVRKKAFRSGKYWSTHASAYATYSPAEDFAETFEVFMRHKNNLDRFRARPGFYRKLKAVETAIKNQKKELK
jgi:hypothetical protein